MLLYVGVALLSSLSMTGLAAIIHLRSGLSDRRGPATRRRLVGSVATSIAFALALLLGTLVPVVHYFALWLLAVTGPFVGLTNRRLDRREASRALPVHTAGGRLTHGDCARPTCVRPAHAVRSHGGPSAIRAPASLSPHRGDRPRTAGWTLEASSPSHQQHRERRHA